MSDQFRHRSDSLTAPSSNCYAIVPSDNAALPSPPKAIYVGSGGNVVLRPLRSQADVTFRNLPAGGILDVRASHVRASGTTAADLVALA